VSGYQPVELDVDLLRSLFRNLSAFRSIYESEGVDVIQSPNGDEWCLWDVEYLYQVAIERLPLRQSQAIQLFLFDNLRESDVAGMMGLKPSNPIGMYATSGLERLLTWINNDELENFTL